MMPASYSARKQRAASTILDSAATASCLPRVFNPQSGLTHSRSAPKSSSAFLTNCGKPFRHQSEHHRGIKNVIIERKVAYGDKFHAQADLLTPVCLLKGRGGSTLTVAGLLRICKACGGFYARLFGFVCD